MTPADMRSSRPVVAASQSAFTVSSCTQPDASTEPVINWPLFIRMHSAAAYEAARRV